MSERNAELPHPAGDQAQSIGVEQSATLPSAATTIADEQQRIAAAVTPGAPFRSLATVELQLIMQHCDLNTLLALARCNRFTLSSASHPFAWRALSPLLFPTTIAGRLRGSRLLAHCDVALRWLPPTNWRWQPNVGDAELAAIESVPRLVELDARSRKVQGAEFRRLLSRPSMADLTALHCRTSQIDSACTALLPLHQPRLHTLSLTMEISRQSEASHRLLDPLALLPTLADLSLDGRGIGEGVAGIIGRCDSLRRLHLSPVEPDVLLAVLMAPARARLESLSLRDVSAHPQLLDGVATAADRAAATAAYAHSWRVCFENLQCLGSLSLQQCGGLDELLAGAAAALATGRALRSLTALRADTLKMDSADGSLIPLLAAHCPQLRRLHIYEITSGLSPKPGALGGLPSLSSLSDLRLQCSPSQLNHDELAVGRCASLTRLHLAHVRRSSLHSILRSPQMQRLEALSLGFVQFDRRDRAEGPDAPLSLDWSVCFANLRSLRALNLEICTGGDQLLAAVQAACPPLLCSMRFSHSSGRVAGVVPEPQLLPALLVQLPSLRVELIKEAPLPRGISYREVDKPHELRHLYAAWHKLKRQHPERVKITQLAAGNVDPLGTWSD